MLQTVRLGPEVVSQFDQPPKIPVVFAVKVIGVPLAKLALHVVAQLRPAGELVMLPVPVPANCAVRIGAEPPPVPVKQTTVAVMEPVTIAPEEDRLPAL